MRLTSKRPRARALLFLPFALALASGRADQETAAPGKNIKDVQITLVMQSDGKLMPVPDIDPVPLSKKLGHRARWIYCGQGELDIQMKGEDPFDGASEHGSVHDCKHVRSPKIKSAAAVKKHPYTISVTGVPNTKPNDPSIEIME